jgi:hypothetical protein
MPASLRAVIASELPRDVTRASAIIGELLRRHDFDRPFALRLFASSRNGNASHELRCLASLALEHQFRLASPGQAASLLRGIGIAENETDVRRRIARNEPVHSRLRRGGSHLRSFLRHSRRECRLYFARYAFTPEEVVAAIRERTRATPAHHDFPPLIHPHNVDEARLALESLPPYEREIVRLLIAANVVYWVDDATPSSLNALVEYPEGTIVLVIKPPGSDIEIEIKRAGLRGPRALDVRYRDADGEVVPIHHHLWGGSRGDYLRFETANSALLARIHRLALGGEAPIPRIVTLARVESVPDAAGNATTLLSHFSNPARRADLLAALQKLERDDLVTPLDFPAGRFLEATMPTQAIVVGTTSFRLERLRAYLNDGIPFDGDTDELLDEIIDDYVAPPGHPGDHAAAAFAHNRAAADRTYLSIVTQIGRFWGAVLGMRGGSGGESFVIRNAGLRKVWMDGRWQVRFISMDHDSMALAGRIHRFYNPAKNVNAFILDQAHILGGPTGKRFHPGELGALKAIYRVSPPLAREGLALFRAALRETYARTLHALSTDPRIRELFHEEYINTLREWDRTVIDYFRNGRDAASKARWRRRTKARLRRRGIPPPIIEQYLKTILTYTDVLPWFAGLYESAMPTPSSAAAPRGSRNRGGGLGRASRSS